MTSARRQAPHHLEHTRVDLLLHLSCSLVDWSLAHWANAAGYLSSVSDSLALRSFSVSEDCLSVLPPSTHVQAQKVLAKRMCRQNTHRGSDVRLDMSRFMGLDEWSRRRLTGHVGTGDYFTAGSGNPAVTSQNLMAFSVTMTCAVVSTSARTVCADSLSINHPLQ